MFFHVGPRGFGQWVVCGFIVGGLCPHRTRAPLAALVANAFCRFCTAQGTRACSRWRPHARNNEVGIQVRQGRGLGLATTASPVTHAIADRWPNSRKTCQMDLGRDLKGPRGGNDSPCARRLVQTRGTELSCFWCPAAKRRGCLSNACVQE